MIDGKKPVVLIIDDTQSNIELLTKVLEADCEILFATGGREGLRLAAAEHPDLIILDVMMPEMDGYQVCMALKKGGDTADIPVIFVTAKTLDEEETLGLELGAVDYITKPFSPIVVSARVRNHLELKRRGDLLIKLAEAGEQAKREFLRNISHELRTPMNPILGFSSLLSQVPPESRDQAQEYGNLINQAATRMISLVEDLIQLSSLDRGIVAMNPAPIDLRELFAALETEFAPCANSKGLELRLSLEPDCPVEPFGFRQILYGVLKRLIANAVKFTSVGKIEISGRNERGRGVSVVVRDTGKGIPHDMQGAILSDFTQAEESLTRTYGGLGLGLSIARRLIAIDHGTITVESDEGRGSAFTVFYPVHHL